MKDWLTFIFAAYCVTPLLAQTPEWIWFRKTDSSETRHFRKSFTLEGPATSAELVATADDGLEVFVNGAPVLSANEWGRGHRADVKSKLKIGRNTVAIRAINGDASAAGVLARLSLITAAGKQTIVTDATWKAEDRTVPGWNQVAYDDAGWAAAKSLGKLGIEPWGDVLANAAAAPPAVQVRRQATPPDALYTLKDFKVELLRSAEFEEGSWVNLCKDNRGRLIISPQYLGLNLEGGLIRVTLNAEGQVAKHEFIALR